MAPAFCLKCRRYVLLFLNRRDKYCILKGDRRLSFCPCESLWLCMDQCFILFLSHLQLVPTLLLELTCKDIASVDLSSDSQLMVCLGLQIWPCLVFAIVLPNVQFSLGSHRDIIVILSTASVLVLHYMGTIRDWQLGCFDAGANFSCAISKYLSTCDV